MNQRMNVLLITADEWRGDTLSAVGHPTVKTPNLDALAADGVLFRSHFAQCTPCGPSRASLLTGTYMMNHRSVQNGVPLESRFTNVALEARGAGYDPWLIGYTDTTLDPREHSANDPALADYTNVLPGFRQLVPGSEDGTASTAWLRHLAAKGYEIPSRARDIYLPVENNPDAGGRGPTFPPARYLAKDSDTAFSTDCAIEFLARPERSPWFLHLSLIRPHPPFVAPEPYNAMYEPDDVPGPRGLPSDDEPGCHPFTAYVRRHHLELEGLPPEMHPAEDAAMRQLRATYYGLMTEVDHHLGRIIALLKETGQYEDTLIVFTSDHGEQLWDHGMLGKECQFDQSFHIPLLIRAPYAHFDPSRGRVEDAFTENVDLMSTILDLLGCEVPLQCDGASLRPFLEGGTPRRWRREVHWEFDFRDIADGKAERELGIRLDECVLTVIRDTRYKYIHYAALPAQLFDIENDPDEIDDLGGNPHYMGTVAEYAQKMLSWRMIHAERSFTGRQSTIEAQRSRR